MSESQIKQAKVAAVCCAMGPSGTVWMLAAWHATRIENKDVAHADWDDAIASMARKAVLVALQNKKESQPLDSWAQELLKAADVGQDAAMDHVRTLAKKAVGNA